MNPGDLVPCECYGGLGSRTATSNRRRVEPRLEIPSFRSRLLTAKRNSSRVTATPFLRTSEYLVDITAGRDVVLLVGGGRTLLYPWNTGIYPTCMAKDIDASTAVYRKHKKLYTFLLNS